uniref:Hexosyltransferase n=1 Tax=Lepisosteus oculatus TaxID=7918 RepID=W5M0U6_LEPOC
LHIMTEMRKKLFLCLPCICLVNLFLYGFVFLSVSLSHHPPASGASRDKLRPSPGQPVQAGGAFWATGLDESALWNLLQHMLDRRHNPLLRANASRPAGNGSEPPEGGATPGPRPPLAGIWAEQREWSGPCRRDPRMAAHLGDFNTLPGHVQDFVVSMHCREYPLLIDQPRLCQGGAPTLLLAIKSQVGNFENRQAIRETWGRGGQLGPWTVQTVFLLGRQDPSLGSYPDLGGLLQLEQQLHPDILQWDFRDTFFNLTLKDVLFLRWFARHCPAAGFVFKGDDDVFLNTGELLRFLAAQEAAGASRDLFVGEVIVQAAPMRDPALKYFVPESFFKGGYPPYAGGGGVVYSGPLALRLARVTERVTLFPIDDVYLGMCLLRLGVAPSTHPGFRTFDIEEKDRAEPCAHRHLLLVHRRSPSQTIALWRRLTDPQLQC